MKVEILETEKQLKDKWKNKIIIITKSQLTDVFDGKQDKEIIESLKYITSNKIETFDDKYLATFAFDFAQQEGGSRLEKIGLYSDFKTFAIYVAQNKTLLAEQINKRVEKGLDFAGILISLISSLTDNDYNKLENIENELNKIEDKLSASKSFESCTTKMAYYRRMLIRYKHHYEQLNNIIDFFSTRLESFTLQEEKNNYFILSKRIPKLYSEIVYLREILSQLRDSYQAQVEIKQNNLMKIFTIINAIFMPLQLVVGWYGMNLIMPENKWLYTYPIVIAISIVFVVVMIIVFSKKKYFKQ